jgi:hypothetical protein
MVLVWSTEVELMGSKERSLFIIREKALGTKKSWRIGHLKEGVTKGTKWGTTGEWHAIM